MKKYRIKNRIICRYYKFSAYSDVVDTVKYRLKIKRHFKKAYSLFKTIHKSMQ